MKLLRIISTTLIFLILSFKISYAEPVKVSNLAIQGNKKITFDTIVDLLNLQNKMADSNNLNEYQKKIFQSNFFESVNISYKNKKIFITVVENPLVDYIFIEGVKSEKLLNDIKDILVSKENTLFSEISLNSDVERISNLITSLGYFKSNINYQVVKPKPDKVNIFFNITLNKKFTINKIFFIGDKKIKSSKLLSIISSSPKNLFSFFSSSNSPSSDRIDYDISLLKKYYLNRGYYNVQIPNGSIEIINDGRANIVFTINAGNKFSLNNARVDDVSNILSKKDILIIKNILDPLVNEVYNLEKLGSTLNKISRYIDGKNLNATIAYDIQQLDTKKLDVSFRVKEILKKIYIRNIIIKGNDLTEEKVIRNKINFAEGDLFSNLKISNSIDSLKSSGFFKDININKKEIEKSDNVDIVIKVTEAPTGEISAGIGVGSNGSNVSFNFKENNLLGQGLGFGLLGSFGTESISANFSVTNPDFANSGNLLKTGFYISKFENSTSGYENQIIGSSISTGYEWLEDVNLQYGISVDMDDLNADADASSLIKTRSGTYFTNKFFYSVLEDKRNRKFKPDEGYTVGFSQGIAHIGSDIPYLSNTFYGSFYNKFSESFIGKINYNVNSINSFETSKDIKLSDRLFLSENQLRGFKYKSFGPMVDKDFIGGNYSYSTSFSTTVPNGLPETWNSSSSFFLDVGNVWGSDFDVTSEGNKIRSSVGVGLSWNSPIGPIGLSYAEPIQKSSFDEVENFTFKLGGVF